MEKVVIDLREFGSLKNELYLEGLEQDRETGIWDYDKIRGTLTVSQDELAEVLGEELKYQILEMNNHTPEWDFDYPGLEIYNCTGFEVLEIRKIEDEKVYFRVV